MKKLLLSVASSALMLGALCACDNSSATLMPGAALVQDQFAIVIADSFKIEARSILNPSVQSRTTTQLLGAIDAPTYGTLRADFVAQLFPSTNIDVTGVELDSVKLQLVFDKDGFVGDSLAPIGFEVYPLSDTLPYPIYSNFPEGTRYASTGFYNANPGPDDCHGTGMFTAVGGAISDENAASSYRFAYANLPTAFGQKILDAFANPATRPLFNSPDDFANDIFPGVYVRCTFGSGRVTRVSDTRLLLYYRKRSMIENDKGELVDSLQHLFSYAMVSAPEVPSNTCIDLQMAQSLDQMADSGRAVIVSPAGRDVELRFPIEDVISAYDNATVSTLSLINTMTFTIPADSIANGRGINPPTYLLMVLKKDKDKFFAANKLPDDVTSFTAELNSNTMTYDFGNMRNYLMEMIDKKGSIAADDFTFVLTPVSMVMDDAASSYYAVSSTDQTLSGMSPMIAMPSMVELLPSKAKITLTFSKQQLK